MIKIINSFNKDDLKLIQKIERLENLKNKINTNFNNY